MTQEEIIRAEYIKMCITFRDICSNYKYLTEEDYKLLDKYLEFKINN